MKACNFIKTRLQHSYFRVNIAKLLKMRIHCEICLSDYLLKHNLMYNFIKFNLEISTNHHKRKIPYPHVFHVSMLWTLVDLFLMKRLFHGRLYQIIFPEIKTGSFTIEFRYLSNKWIQNWYTLQDIYRWLFVNDKKVKRLF